MNDIASLTTDVAEILMYRRTHPIPRTPEREHIAVLEACFPNEMGRIKAYVDKTLLEACRLLHLEPTPGRAHLWISYKNWALVGYVFKKCNLVWEICPRAYCFAWNKYERRQKNQHVVRLSWDTPVEELIDTLKNLVAIHTFGEDE